MEGQLYLNVGHTGLNSPYLGSWIAGHRLREDDVALRHVLRVLALRGAPYRFGAPLDVRWLAGGWSSHLEHWRGGLRLRTEFVTRPRRLSVSDLARLWRDADASGQDVVGLEPLALMKMTRREKDYAGIGELARRMPDVASQLRWSRSARDLSRLASEHPEALADAVRHRPVLERVHEGRDVLEAALDRERRLLMRADETRLTRFSRGRGMGVDLARRLAPDRGTPARRGPRHRRVTC